MTLADLGRLSVASYVLEDCLRPIGSFEVSKVPLVPLGRAGSYEFYPPPMRGADKHARKRPRLAAEEESGALPLEDGNAESEGGDTTEDELDEDTFAEHEEVIDEEGSLEAFLDSIADALMQPPQAEPVEEMRPSEAPVVEAPEPDLGVPPPPMPPADEDHRAGLRKNRGEATVVFRWGKITFYASKGVFEATCRNPDHGKCVLTRTHKAKASSARGQPPKGGRPLGLLAAWLEKGGVGSKEEHWRPDALRPSVELRRAGRAYIRGAQHGPELLAKERPLAEGEPEEPLSLDGLV